MQQASTGEANQRTGIERQLDAAAFACAIVFVINLCGSTTPVALTPPDHAGLKRFTFFVSRRREEGRERFRLHMGYFDSQEDAEQLLDIVREIYPGAWAGLAPGQRLRAQAEAEAPNAAAPGRSCRRGRCRRACTAALAPAPAPAVVVAAPVASAPAPAAAVEPADRRRRPKHRRFIDAG